MVEYLMTLKKAKVPDKMAALPAAGKLDQKISVNFRRTPLQDAIAMIAGEIQVTFEIDGDALKFGGYTKNMTQDFVATNQSAKDVVSTILQMYSDPVRPEKTLVVAERGDGLVLTTAAAAERGKQKVLLPKAD